LKQEIVLPVQESEEYARPFDPRFFALSCDSYKGYFSMIQVDDYNHYQKYLTDEAKSSHGLKTGSLCNIAYCAKDGYEKGFDTGNTADTCRCTTCDKGFTLLKGDGMNVWDYCAREVWKIETTQYLLRTKPSISGVQRWGESCNNLGCGYDGGHCPWCGTGVCCPPNGAGFGPPGCFGAASGSDGVFGIPAGPAYNYATLPVCTFLPKPQDYSVRWQTKVDYVGCFNDASEHVFKSYIQPEPGESIPDFFNRCANKVQDERRGGFR
jgi:hypothetical protein